MRIEPTVPTFSIASNAAIPLIQQKILVIDVGGTHVKLYLGSEDQRREFVSGKEMTPEQCIMQIDKMVNMAHFDAISMGFPAPIKNNQLLRAPVNLGAGWENFDFTQAIKLPFKLINDAAMQAVGSYEGGRMLFLGLGTGLGSALIIHNQLQPMELAHLPFWQQHYEYYVSEQRRKTIGNEAWQKDVLTIVQLLYNAFMPDYIVLGGGNVHHLDQLPAYIRRGDNDRAYLGGIRIWSNDK